MSNNTKSQNTQDALSKTLVPDWDAVYNLIKQGADINYASDLTSDETEFAKYIDEIVSGYYSILNNMESVKANLNLKNGEINTYSPIVLAIFGRNFRLLAELINHGANVNQVINIDGNDPMTAMDYIEMEYHCTTHTGEDLIISGMKEFLLFNGAKHNCDLPATK